MRMISVGRTVLLGLVMAWVLYAGWLAVQDSGSADAPLPYCTEAQERLRNVQAGRVNEVGDEFQPGSGYHLQVAPCQLRPATATRTATPVLDSCVRQQVEIEIDGLTYWGWAQVGECAAPDRPSCRRGDCRGQSKPITVAPTRLPTLTPTSIVTPTPTMTLVPTATLEPTPSPTSITVTISPSPEPSPTPIASPTAPIPTAVATFTAQPTATALATESPVPTLTRVPSPSSTSTSIPTATYVPSPSPTVTAVPTIRPTATAVPTSTATPVPTRTAVPATATPVPTSTSTATLVPTGTPEPTATPAPTFTPEPTATREPVATETARPRPGCWHNHSSTDPAVPGWHPHGYGGCGHG